MQWVGCADAGYVFVPIDSCTESNVSAIESIALA